MSKPGKVLRTLCKRLGVRLTVKRGKKRIYKSVAVLKAQCKRKKKKVIKKRKRKFGAPIDRRKIRARRAKERKRKGLYYVPLRNLPYIEDKEAKKYLLQRKGLREAQDFDALEKLIEKRLKEERIRDRYTKISRGPVNVKKGISKSVKAVDPDSFKYEVEGSKPGSKYSIDLLHMACTCGDFRFRRSDKSKEDPSRLCKHIDQIFRQKGISQQQWCEHVGKEGSVDPEVMNRLLGLTTFGKKKEKISASLKKLCKKHKVRLTVKRGKKRVYKSVKVLKAQCQRKVKRKRKRKFGSVSRMVPVNFRDIQRGSEYTVIYKEEMVRRNQVRGPRVRRGIVTAVFPNEDDDHNNDINTRQFIVVDFDDDDIVTAVFPREIDRIEKVKVDFSFLPGDVNPIIGEYL